MGGLEKGCLSPSRPFLDLFSPLGVGFFALIDTNSALFLTLLIGAELGIAIALTPRLVTWYLKRNLGSILDTMAENKEAFEKLKKVALGSFFGSFGGGRPPSFGALIRMAVAQGLSKLMEGTAENPLGTLLQAKQLHNGEK